MSSISSTTDVSPLAALRRLAKQQQPQPERCDLCGISLHPEHQHLMEPAIRRLICCCDACAILFSGNGHPKYRHVPRRIELLPDFQMTEVQWEAFHLPINLAFFYHSTPAGRVIAVFPSPAGATESLLTLETWMDLVIDNPVLSELEPDVEALLVNRVGHLREHTRVPIDQCFKLVGLIRTHWRGLSGGTEVWKQIAHFTEGLKARAVTRRGKNA